MPLYYITKFFGDCGITYNDIFPLFLYGFLFFSTMRLSELTASFQKWKVPQAILIPILVMCRFLPTLHFELINIANAMILKGGKLNIIKYIEFIYVPLLFSSVKIAEELTISALTRGLGLYKTTTATVDARIKLFDIFCIVAILVLILSRRASINA